MDIAIRSWIATILFLSHTGLEWIAISGLATLKKICVKQKKRLWIGYSGLGLLDHQKTIFTCLGSLNFSTKKFHRSSIAK